MTGKSRAFAIVAGLAFAFGGAVTTAATAATPSSVLGSCTNPDCIRGVPPVATRHAPTWLAECTDEQCLPGTKPLVVRRA